MAGRARILQLAAATGCALLAISCVRSSDAKRTPQTAVDIETAASAFHRPYASVRPVADPLWFELGPEGPVSVSGPLDSSLAPFEPWPLAHRAAGIVAYGDSLVMAANKEGFLSLVPRSDGGLSLYRVADTEFLARYSIASVFMHEGKPTLLVYRDRFFVDPSEPVPAPRCFSLEAGKASLESVEPPFLSKYPASQSWDIESLILSSSGRVFLRAVRENDVAYASAPSLTAEASEETAGSYRAAVMPRESAGENLPLARVIEAAAQELAAGKAKVAAACGAGKPFQESYLVSPRKEGAAAVLASSDGGVERVWAYYDNRRAMLLFPDGSFLLSDDAGAAVSRGSLPELPDGFFYTGIALVGPTAAALWEEQDGWAVGSSGFVLVNVSL